MVNKRIPLGDLADHLDEEVRVAGWVDSVRNLKKMQFAVLNDGTGAVQLTNQRDGGRLDELVSGLSPSSTVAASGKLVYNPHVKLGNVEIQLSDLEITSAPMGSSPINEGSNLDLRLDWRFLDLRDPKKRLIFQIQTTAEHAMREYWMKHGFTEIHSPKLTAGATESGAELFQLDYFGQSASLAQSPQFYKQMAMAAGMGRIFEIGPVFRANKSHTRRHDTEFTSVDSELSWIDSYHDVMEFEEGWIQYLVGEVAAKHGKEIESLYGIKVEVPTIPFPRITMKNAYSILDKLGHVIPLDQEGDLDPTGEKLIGAEIRKRFGHDFVFVTEYPTSVRPFYHMRDSENPDITNSFDLLWKGMEVTTGAQREHRHDVLRDQAIDKGVDPQAIGHYLDFFKYGCPPHGGFGFGLTRMLMNLTGINNVREVTYLYRGVNRLTP